MDGENGIPPLSTVVGEAETTLDGLNPITAAFDGGFARAGLYETDVPSSAIDDTGLCKL